MMAAGGRQLKIGRAAVPGRHSNHPQGRARSEYKAHRVVWVILAAVPLLVWLALVALALVHHPGKVDTGDALLDAYLQHVIDTDVRLSRWDAPAPITPRQAEQERQFWQALERKYGQDSRFWELRFCAAPVNSYTWYTASFVSGNTLPEEYYSTTAQLNLPVAYSYLEEARRRGVASGRVYCALLSGYELFWQQEANDASSGSPMPNKTMADRIALIQQIRAVVDTKHRQAEHELLADWQSAAPKDALPYYFMALVESERNNFAGAKACFTKANNYINSGDDTLYPRTIWDQTVKAITPIQDEYVSCVLEHNTVGITSDYSFFLKGMQYKMYAILAEQSGDLDGVNEEFQAVVASYPVKIYTLLNSLIFLGKVLSIYNPFLDYSHVKPKWQHRLTQQQIDDFHHFINISQQFKQECKAISQSTPFPTFVNLPKTFQPFADKVFEKLAGPRITSMIQLKQYWEMYAEESRAVRQRLVPLFDELARFDFATLSWREAAP